MRRSAIIGAAATGAAALAAAALAGCASYLPVNGEGARTALPPSAQAADTPQPSPAPQAYAPAAPPAPAAHDTCGAGSLAYLVGKPRTEIPVPTDLARRRVVCTTCPMTSDVRPERQTITYDAASGKVAAVTCG